MDALAVVVMLLALLALAGVVTFFLWDYFKHKDDNDKNFQEAASRIEAEKEDRLSNLKFVVDQVNDVNTDIYMTMSSNLSNVDTATSRVEKVQTDMLSGIDKFLRFNSNVSISESPQVSLMNLPGTSTPDVQLIQHVTAVMGITATDLAPKNAVEFCNKNKTKCIRFPDNNGDTYITSLDNNKNVVVDAPLRVHGDLKMMSTVSGTTTSVEQATLSAVQNGVVLQTGKVGIGSSGFSNPSASLHIQSVQGQDAFKVSANASDAILVKADGELVTTKPISMRTNASDLSSVATFSIADSTGNPSAKVLKIKASRVEVDGDFSVAGNLEVTGSGRIQGAPIATSTQPPATTA